MTSDDVVDHELTVDGDWRENKFFRRRPSTETLIWAAASVGKGSRIVGHRRLTGGVNPAVHRLTVQRHHTRTFVVFPMGVRGPGMSCHRSLARGRLTWQSYQIYKAFRLGDP